MRTRRAGGVNRVMRESAPRMEQNTENPGMMDIMGRRLPGCRKKIPAID
jgi:hypothetical protein